MGNEQRTWKSKERAPCFVKIQCHSKGSYEIKGTYCSQRNGKHDELLGKIRTGVVFPENNKNANSYEYYFLRKICQFTVKRWVKQDSGKFQGKEV